VILQQDFLGNFSVQGWFAIAFPFYLLIFVHSLFLVFSSTSLRHLFLSFTISFNFSKPKPVFSFMLSIHLNRGLPCLLHPSTCPIIMSHSSVPSVLITCPKYRTTLQQFFSGFFMTLILKNKSFVTHMHMQMHSNSMFMNTDITEETDQCEKIKC